MYLAMAALLLGDYQSPLYRPNTSPGSIHKALFETSRSFATDNPSHVEDLELLQAFNMYMIYSGSHIEPSSIDSIVIAVKQGYLDESLPEWDSLSNDERNSRRRIAWGAISTSR